MSKTVIIKTSILGFLNLLGALAFGYFFSLLISVPSVSSLIYLLLAAIVFLAFFLVSSLLSGHFWITAGFILSSVVLLNVFLLNSFTVILLVGGFITLGLLIQAYYSSRAEVKNNLTLKFWKISRPAMSLATIALAIFVSFGYISSLNLQDPENSRQVLEALIEPTEQLLSNFLPGELTVASAQATAAVTDLLYDYTIRPFLKLAPVPQTAILVGTALITFFFIKFVLFFINWAATLLGYVIYKSLWSFGFFRTELQNKPKESIILAEETTL